MAPERIISLQEVCESYFGDGQLWSAPLGKGNINDTWLVTFKEHRVVLQRINSTIFKNPEKVIENFQRVTDHIHRRVRATHSEYICPELIATKDGQHAYCDSKGEWWRAQTYIDHVASPVSGINNRSAHQLGKVLATYHHLVSDLDADSLTEVLPGFHNISRYLAIFDEICAQTDYPGSDAPEDCLRFIEKNRPRVFSLEKGHGDGRLATCVIHGDPKLDNVIFTKDGEASGLFDLDTVGPGLVHHDLGDCLRSACNLNGEYTAVENVRFDLEICRSLLRGYGVNCPTLLTEWEKHYIFDCIFTICFELGLRFLTDHLLGDVYFKIDKRGDNLLKCRVQFALAASVLKQEREIRELSESL